MLANNPILEVFSGITVGDGTTQAEGRTLKLMGLHVNLRFEVNALAGRITQATNIPFIVAQWNYQGSPADRNAVWNLPLANGSIYQSTDTITDALRGVARVIVCDQLALTETQTSQQVSLYIPKSDLMNAKANYNNAGQWQPLSEGSIWICFWNKYAADATKNPIFYSGTTAIAFECDPSN